jgi:hypothetical protein
MALMKAGKPEYPVVIRIEQVIAANIRGETGTRLDLEDIVAVR